MIDRPNIEWKVVEGTQGRYEVSNYGDFHRLPFSTIKNGGGEFHYQEKWYRYEELLIMKNGYLRMRMTGCKEFYVHRIVALAFLPYNDEAKTEINHKNGDKRNNFVGTLENGYSDGNLEWCTHLENTKHASTHGLINKESPKRKKQCALNAKHGAFKRQRPILILSLDGLPLWRGASTYEVARKIGCSTGGVQAVLGKRGYHKTIKGFQLIYADDYDAKKNYRVKIKESSKAYRPVIQKDLTGTVVGHYRTIQEACRSNGFTGADYISECCRGLRGMYKGFYWEFDNKD